MLGFAASSLWLGGFFIPQTAMNDEKKTEADRKKASDNLNLLAEALGVQINNVSLGNK